MAWWNGSVGWVWLLTGGMATGCADAREANDVGGAETSAGDGDGDDDDIGGNDDDAGDPADADDQEDDGSDSCKETYTDRQCLPPPGAGSSSSSSSDGGDSSTGPSTDTGEGGLCDGYIDDPPTLYPGGPGGGQIDDVAGPFEEDGQCCFDVTWSQWCPCDRGCG